MKTLKLVGMIALVVGLVWTPMLVLAVIDHGRPLAAQTPAPCRPCKVPFSCVIPWQGGAPVRALYYVPPGVIIRVTAVCAINGVPPVSEVGIGPWPDAHPRWRFDLSPTRLSATTDPGAVFWPGEAIYLVVNGAPEGHRMVVTVAGWAERVEP